MVQKVEADMRPALAIVNKSQGKPYTAGLRKVADHKESFMLSPKNTAKLETENKGWISAVQEHLGTQTSILLTTTDSSVDIYSHSKSTL